MKKYLVAADKIAELISTKNLVVGDRLPSEKTLAEEFEINHITLRKGMEVLAKKELIHTIPSLGSFVGKSPVRKKLSNLAGILIPEHEPFFFDVITALENRLALFDYSLLIHISNRSPLREEMALNSFLKKNVDGIIAAPNRECIELYRKIECPVVFFDNLIAGLKVPYVVNDDFQAACSAIEHLVSLGHCRIAYVGGQGDHSSCQRHNGYQTVLKKYGLENNPEYIKQQEYSRQWGYTAAEALMRLKIPPTAVFCGNDSIASGLLRYLMIYGIKCPEQLSVIGCCNAPFSEDIGLSTVDQQPAQLAECIWNSLQAAISGKKVPAAVMIPSRVIIRRTTAAPPVAK